MTNLAAASLASGIADAATSYALKILSASYIRANTSSGGPRHGGTRSGKNSQGKGPEVQVVRTEHLEFHHKIEKKGRHNRRVNVLFDDG